MRSYSETRPCNYCGTAYRRRTDAAARGAGLHCSAQCWADDRYGPLKVNPDEIRTMYCDRDMTMKEIAAEIGVGWKRVQRAVIALGVPIRSGRRRIPHKRSAATYRKIVRPAPGQVVHHLNCVETDDRPDNLVAVSRARHAELHCQLERLAARLFDAGLISFDPVVGYQLGPDLRAILTSIEERKAAA